MSCPHTICLFESYCNTVHNFVSIYQRIIFVAISTDELYHWVNFIGKTIGKSYMLLSAKYAYVFTHFTLSFLMYFGSYFDEFGMPKRLCELIDKDKKFCILCLRPSFLWQGFRQVRVPKWERGLNISWSTRYYGQKFDLIWISNQTCKLGSKSYSQ